MTTKGRATSGEMTVARTAFREGDVLLCWSMTRRAALLASNDAIIKKVSEDEATIAAIEARIAANEEKLEENGWVIAGYEERIAAIQSADGGERCGEG